MSKKEGPFTLKRRVREMGGSLNVSIPKEIVYKLKFQAADWLSSKRSTGTTFVFARPRGLGGGVHLSNPETLAR